MTQDELKQAADEMVEVFMPFAYYNTESVNVLKEQVSNATRIAIAHCKRVIEVLEKSKPLSVYELNNHRLILSELEGRVK
jgi:hypothetical protein